MITDKLTLPKILDIPDKLLPVLEKFDDYRYFLIEGGRGGGKSQLIARFILYLTNKYKLRTVCGREVQNSVNESVYSLIVDLIREYQLNFTIQATKITSNTTGSEINFRGFREQGRFQIQGLEGITLLWIDEAQAITKETLNVLVPTIRREDAKIIFTMNRHIEHDPVYETFHARPDCLHININYNDNPFCTEALKNEAEECRKKSEQDYKHIWLGEPLAMSEDCLFAYQELKDSYLNKHIMPEGYGLKLAGFDVARYGDDKCAVVIVQQMGALNWEVVFTDQWDKRDLNYTTGRILTTSMEQDVFKSAIDEDGIGSGPLDTLNKGRNLDNFVGFKNPQISYQNNKYYGNNRTANAYKVKDMVGRGHLVITQEELIRELCTLRYTYDHNQRKVLISKEKMRKDGVKSPNLADSLIYACSLIGDINYQQTEQFQVRQPQYSREDSLFQMAGVR